ncbi:TPA: hypothetical protein DCE37_05735 [Candidatus Latescibacteria bacterium]|nr:hypothetical protein [Candidatus Latescibacterota bacterium]
MRQPSRDRLFPEPGLNQVFLNILINAAQAIDGEGRIALRTSVDGDTVVIEVQDSGVGIE